MRAVVGVHHFGEGGRPPLTARFDAGMRGRGLAALGEPVTGLLSSELAAAVSGCAIRRVRLPFSDARKVAQVAPYEVDGKVPFELEAAVVSHHVLAASGSEAQVLVAACPRSRIAALLAGLSTEGREGPRLILPEAVALHVFARHLAPAVGGTFLVADARPERILLVAIDGAGRWLGSRSLSCPWDPCSTELPDAAAVAELRRGAQSLWVSSRERPGRLLVTGEGCGGHGEPTPPMIEALGQALDIEATGLGALAERLTPVLGPRAVQEAGRISVHAVAVGMALAATERAPLMNLRSGPFALYRESDVEGVSRLVGAGVGLLAVMLLAWADGYVHYQQAERRLTDQKKVMEAQYRQVFPNAGKVVDPLAQAKTELARATGRGLLAGVGDLTPLAYLNAISQAVPPGIFIEVNELTVEEKRLRLEAEAASFDAIDQIKSALERVPQLVDVRVSDAKQGASADRVRFRVSATLAEGV